MHPHQHLSSLLPEVNSVEEVIKRHLNRGVVKPALAIRAQNASFQARQLLESLRKHHPLHFRREAGLTRLEVEFSVKGNCVAGPRFDAYKANCAGGGIHDQAVW